MFQRGITLIAIALLTINSLAVYSLIPPNTETPYSIIIAVNVVAILLGGLLVAFTD